MLDTFGQRAHATFADRDVRPAWELEYFGQNDGRGDASAFDLSPYFFRLCSQRKRKNKPTKTTIQKMRSIMRGRP